MSDRETKETAQERFALSILEASEQTLIEKFMRCERSEALEFLSSATQGYRIDSARHDTQARLFRAAAEKLERALARLNGGDPPAESPEGAVSPPVERALDDTGLQIPPAVEPDEL
ncbi:MAG: hypothetical protein ACE5H8_05185 [Alphaproteobacteria bacterium]